jgi:hypothetical protein
MRYKTLALSALSLLLTLTTFHAVARAADDDQYKDDDYGYEETARVARVSLIAGDVSLRRAGSDKWEHAAPNLPLVEGDRLTTGANSRLEIQIDSRNFLRVGEYATLDIVTLRDEGVALSLPTGTATLRLARFDRDKEYFEIDAPGTTVAAEKTGLYRLDVEQNGKVRVAVRDGGRARLYSESSGFTLRDGRAAETVFADNARDADWEFSNVRPFDNFDTWVDERERYLLARLRYDNRDRYYDPQVYGAEELDAYGDWVETHDYGYVWRPRVTVINNYNDWAPYRYGHWDWCPPYGWVWVGDEPWGWAPYHYGRWVYYDNNWCWAPRGYFGYRHRSWWRPALVAFVNVHLSFGDNICWYPLPYHHSDPHSNFWRRALHPDRLTALRRDELANLQRVNPIYRRAVSGLPARDFTRGGSRPRHVDEDTARIALATDPVRGRFPLRPSGGEGGATNTRDRSGDGRRAALPARGDVAGIDPARAMPERRTGAGARRPGVPLDEELRRQRILNNREPVVNRGTGGGGSSADSGAGDPARRENPGGNERGTGAVARPSRPMRLPDTNGASGAPDTRGDNSGGGTPGRTERRTRPDARPDNPETQNERPRDGGATDTPERTANPAERERRGGDDRGDNRRDDGADRNSPPDERRARPDARESRPATPERDREPREDRPTRTVERREPPAERRESQPERRVEPQPERRAEPAPREERPAPRHEERPSPPREERQSPPREERPSPPPREERSSPPREERSAPREERSAPREEKSPPPKSEERRSEPSHDSAKPSRERPPLGE